MKKSIIELIKETCVRAKTYPNPVIEYNIDKLPEDEDIESDSFYGIKAVPNDRLDKNTLNITYKL